MTIKDFLKEASFDHPAIAAAQTRQLHIVVRGLTKEAGLHIDNEFDMSAALNTLGRKLYIKRAEWRMVREGLVALEDATNA